MKKSKSGMTYMSGNIVIGGVRTYIAVFKNTNKKDSKHPDYNISISKPLAEQRSETQPAQPAQEPAKEEAGYDAGLPF